MRFSGTEAHWIATGRKTELRRPWQPSSPFHTLTHAVQVERPRTYEDAPARHADDTSVVDTVCQLVIVGQREASIADMTEADARAEGFRSNGKLTALAQFREQWSGGDRVWVVRFEVERDESDRFLARGSGYTHAVDMAIDELPAVPKHVQEAITKEAKLHDHLREQQRRQEYERRSTVDRLAAVRAEAVARNIDISGHERVIVDRIDRIEKQLGKDKAA